MNTSMTADDIECLLEVNGRVFLPKGTYTLPRTLVLPSDVTITGAGKGTVIVCDGDFAAFKSDTCGTKPSNTTISFLCIRHTNTLDPLEAVLQRNSDGIVLWGDNHNVHNVWLENCFVPLKTVEQTPGDTASYSTDLVLEKVRCSHANPLATTAQYGLLLYSITGADVIACEWRHAWLDGIKLLKNCRDIKVIGGCASDNGQVRWVTSTGAGDGLDGFSGARDVLLDGVTFAGNGGSGCVFKTIGIQRGLDFRPYGPCKNIRIKNCNFRGNNGIDIALDSIYNSTSSSTKGPHLANAAEDDRPRLAHVSIEGCTLDGDSDTEIYGLSGILVNALDVSISNTTIRSKGVEGIIIGENARDVSINGVSVLGCSVDSAGARPAITVEQGAQRVTFAAVKMNGKQQDDSVDIIDDTSYAALTTLHRSGIEILVGANDIVVEESCTNKYTTTAGDYDATAVVIASGSWVDERIIIHHKGTETTGNSRYSGGPGSTYRNVAAGANGQTFWFKEVGDPDTLTGWVPILESSTVQTLASNGTVSLNTKTTLLSVTGTKAYTIAAGTYEGQQKTLDCTVAASTPIGTVTGTFIRGATAYTMITFAAVGQAVDLEYHATGGWRILRVRPDTATSLVFPVIA